MNLIFFLLLVFIGIGIFHKLNHITMTLDELTAKVTEEDGDIDSLVTLTNGLKQQLADALAGELSPAAQAKVDAIFSDVSAKAAQIVTALNA